MLSLSNQQMKQNIYNSMKTKQKKKETKQSKKRQLLTVFHQTVEFLQVFTWDQLDYLQEKIHIFVFTRGQCLAKQKEFVDYIGVIAEGRAVSKEIAYQIGDVIGHTQVLGYQNNHTRTINAESDGVIIAIRIIDFLTIEKISLKNRILNKLIQIYASQLMKRQQISKTYEQFETIQQKKISKYLTQQWASFLSNDIDSKEKSKFLTYFPFYKLKQKDLIANSTLKPSLIYVIQGQLIAKNKDESKIIQSGTMFNVQGFIFSQSIAQNVYCLSNEAVVMVVDKLILLQTFKMQTYKSLNKILLNELANKYKKQELAEDSSGRQSKSWSIFKKYPNAQILPLPKKNETLKTKPVNNPNEIAYLTNFQTLFREQLGTTNTKQKTVGSIAESGYQKLFTMKTQSATKQVQATLQLQKLRKEVDLLSQKLKLAEDMGRSNKLDLIQNKSRVHMSSVLKQISKLYQQGEIIRANGQKQEQAQMGQSFITLKQALDKQLKDNKIQMVVAKCAFKWLYITRKRKGTKKD